MWKIIFSQQLSYRYFVKYKNIGTEWKLMLEDSGITEDLQLGRENVSGLKGKWSKIFLIEKKYFLIIKFHNNTRPLNIFLTIYLYVLRITINITKILQLTTLSSYMKSFGQIFFRLATRSMVY